MPDEANSGYVLLDVYSRYAVAWLVAPRSRGGYARRPAQLARRPGQLHYLQTVTQLLADLGVLQGQPVLGVQLQDRQVLPERRGVGPGARPLAAEAAAFCARVG